MVDYPYILKTGTLRDFLNKIPSIGIPPKINTGTLPTLGYKSPNDRPIVKILRFINFLDEADVPTENYKNFRDKEKSRSVMSSCLRSAYSELFNLYPDASKKDTEPLRNFFSTKTTAGEQVLGRMVDTFKTLCEFADFEAPTITPAPTPIPTLTPLPTPTPTPVVQLPVTKEGGVTINVNIQLELPATQDAEVYDKIFQSLKKHILSPSSKAD